MSITIVQDKMWYMISHTCNSQILSQEKTSVESFEEILFQHSSPTLNEYLPLFHSSLRLLKHCLFEGSYHHFG